MSKQFQLLITTVRKSTNDIKELVKKMNVSSDAIVRCQTSFNGTQTFVHCNKKIVIIFANDSGLSKNRNELLKNATADYIMFADDDEKFVDNYEQKIINLMANYDYADFSFVNDDYNKIIFKDGVRKNIMNSKKIGIISMCFKRSSLIRSGIMFDERFGAGTKYDRGEDTIFRRDIFKSKLNYKSSSEIIFDLFSLKRQSYCVDRFDEKGIESACVFYGFFYGFISFLFIIRLAFKLRGKKTISLRKMFVFRKVGIRLRKE